MQDNRTTDIPVTQVYERAKARWMATNGKRVSMQERFAAALPFFLLVIQISFFWLSASHTIEMVNKIVRGAGWAAAIGFELGLIVLSFMIYKARKAGERMPVWWFALETILFILIIGANFGGSIAAVLEGSSVQAMSADAIIHAFGGLPLNDQIALLLAVLFSVSVPIGSLVVGQAVAHLLLDQEQRGSPLDVKWERVAWRELYTAFYAAALDAGDDPRVAKMNAQRLASGFTGASKPPVEQPVKALPEMTFERPSTPVERPMPTPVEQPVITVERPVGQVEQTALSPKERAIEHLNSNPADASLSVRQFAAKLGISTGTAGAVLKEHRSALVSSNGHGKES